MGVDRWSALRVQVLARDPRPGIEALWDACHGPVADLTRSERVRCSAEMTLALLQAFDFERAREVARDGLELAGTAEEQRLASAALAAASTFLGPGSPGPASAQGTDCQGHPRDADLDEGSLESPTDPDPPDPDPPGAPEAPDPPAPTAAHEAMERALDLAEAAAGAASPPDPLAAYLLAEAAMSLGRLALCDAQVTLGLSAVGDDTSLRLLLHKVQVRQLAYQGRLDEAWAGCQRWLEDPAIAEIPPMHGQALAAAAYLGAAEGGQESRVRENLARALPLATPPDRNFLSSGVFLTAAYTFTLLGDHERAAATVLDGAGGAALPLVRWMDRALSLELLTTAALERGELAEARRLRDEALRMGSSGMAAAAVERTVARVAAAEGEPATMISASERARSLAESEGGHLEAGRAQLLQAGALARSGARNRALEELEQLIRSSADLGSGLVRSQALRLLRRLGRRYRDGTGWESLTERERDVVLLAGQGRTNPEIARLLFVSERTVQTHLASGLRTLGLRTRRELPRLLLREGLVEPPPASLGKLTPRQREVAALVADELTNTEIAARLGVSVKTVEKHLGEVFRAWGLTSRTALVAAYHHAAETTDLEQGDVPGDLPLAD